MSGGGPGGFGPSQMFWATLPCPKYTYQYSWQMDSSQITGLIRMFPVGTGGSPGTRCAARRAESRPRRRIQTASAIPPIAIPTDTKAPPMWRFRVLVTMVCSPLPACSDLSGREGIPLRGSEQKRFA